VAKRFWCDGESGGLGFNINDLCVSMAGRLGGCGRCVSVAGDAVLAGQLLVSVVCVAEEDRGDNRPLTRSLLKNENLCLT
jgi:hypothetical protein